MGTKERIRKRALMLRDAMTETERNSKSRIIIEKVMETSVYRNAEIILAYVNYRSETQTDIFIKNALEAGKKVYCPKVNGEDMDFYAIDAIEELTDGYRGIKEPPVREEMLLCDKGIREGRNMMLMPGCAFDRERNRIGYGKGYYDKYLEKHPGLQTVAVCFECQMQEEILSDEYDKKPDMIITEENIYK